jgi:phage repressor protein C with HTH and peptisase S24 domain
MSQGRLGASLEPRRTTGWVHKLEHNDLKTVWKDTAEQVARILGVPLTELAKRVSEPVRWTDDDAETVHAGASPAAYTLPESLGARRVSRYRGHAGPQGTPLGDDVWDADIFENGEHVSVKVEGDCMEPELHDGDVALVAKEIEPEPGDIVAFSDGDALFFARYRRRGRGASIYNNDGERSLRDVTLEGVVLESKRNFRNQRRRGR